MEVSHEENVSIILSRMWGAKIPNPGHGKG